MAIDISDLPKIPGKAYTGYSAQVVKLVDTPDLGSGAARCVGSSPILGNFLKSKVRMQNAKLKMEEGSGTDAGTKERGIFLPPVRFAH